MASLPPPPLWMRRAGHGRAPPRRLSLLALDASAEQTWNDQLAELEQWAEDNRSEGKWGYIGPYPRKQNGNSGILLHNPIMKRHVLIFGLVGGLLIATLQYTEYRFVIIEPSVQLYSALGVPIRVSAISASVCGRLSGMEIPFRAAAGEGA